MSRHLALALTLAMVPAMAVAQPSAPATATATSAKAMQLLETGSPREEFEREFTRNFIASFNQSITRDGPLAQMEATKPGLIDAIRNAVLNEAKRSLPAEYDIFAQPIVALYQQGLTDSEIDSIIAFLRSPTGMRMTARMKAAAQSSLDNARQNGQGTGNVGALVENATGSAIAAGIQDVTEEDMKVIAAFSTQPAALKMAQLQPKIMAVTTEQTQAMANRLSVKLRPVIQQVVTQYPSQK